MPKPDLELPVERPPADALDAPEHAFELILEAPRGFRPSDWPERLMNWDECAELQVDLVYTVYLCGERLLAVRAELLDASASNAADRVAVWSQVMSFVKTNDFRVLVNPRLESAAPALYERVQNELARRAVPYELSRPG